ncbi:MAG: hypothetical protein WCO00_10030 [Rhodospirillaceae bacterium]
MDSPDTLTLIAIGLAAACAAATAVTGRRILSRRAVPAGDAPPPTSSPVAPLSPEDRRALNDLYQQQIRRLIDLKVDIIRNTSLTQNRILVMQAETLCGAIRQVSEGGAGSEIAAIDPALLASQSLEPQAESERQLAMIDRQIRIVAAAIRS